MLAIAAISFFTAGALANAAPSTSTSAICIENCNNAHTPVPQAPITPIGVEPDAGQAPKKTITDKIIQKINGSGSQRFTI